MQHFQTSFFYDLQELIRNSPLLRKYYYLFKALDLSALPDRNYGVIITLYVAFSILAGAPVSATPLRYSGLRSSSDLSGRITGVLPVDQTKMLVL